MASDLSLRTIDHYRIVERLGGGSAGEVYKAEDLRLNRLVALKLLRRSADARLILRREARVTAALDHPNIATLYELVDDGDESYLAMELVSGSTLETLIASGTLDPERAIDIALQILAALDLAHSRGIIHCDLNASNVMLTSAGVVKLLDFGLATLQADPASTATGGTPGHIAPERLRGRAPDERSDLFSVGVLLYEMLTGRRPFEGSTLSAVLDATLHRQPVPIGRFRDDIPLELERIVRRSLEKDPRERYDSATSMHAELRRLVDELRPGRRSSAQAVTLQTPEAVAGRASRDEFSIRRHALLLIAVALGLLALADLAINWSSGISRTRDLTLLLLAAGITAHHQRSRRKHAILTSPDDRYGGLAFRGLAPFQETDRDHFYGREIETAALVELVTGEDLRFGIIYGESGSGKTSLLRAGVIPWLRDDGYLPLYTRTYKDPLASILRECSRLSGIEANPDETAKAYLRRVSAAFDCSIVIVCDQFEEFYVNLRAPDQREPFLAFVSECHDDRSLPVRFLFSLRSDFLFLIAADFDGRVPEPLLASKRRQLRTLDQDQAREIINRSVERASLPIEPGLARRIARDLSVDDAVLPSELQIVGEQIQNRRIFTIEDYRRAGGKEQLVHAYLEDVIDGCPDRDGTRLLLRSLISDENTRLTLTLDEISARTQRNREQNEHLLELLARARLVRVIQDEEPWRYELTHEYLIERINRISGGVMDATQRANRLLRQYLSNHAIDASTRIPLAKLWFIRRHSDLERGERERELLSRSFRSGVLRYAALVLLLGIAFIAILAALSVKSEWTSSHLSDGHTASVTRSAFSPDGRLLVSTSEDGLVFVWDVASRERRARLTSHKGSVWSVAFAPDGGWFATAGHDGSVFVWSSQTFQMIARLQGPPDQLRSVAVSPDGTLLAAAGRNHGTVLWNTSDWSRAQQLPIDVDWGVVLFAPDGQHLISADGSSWNVVTGRREQATLEPCEGTFAALSADGQRFFSIDPRGDVHLCDMPNRKLIAQASGHRDHGRAAALSPDGLLAASGSEDIVLWDVPAMTTLARFVHSAEVWSLTFSPDGRELVSTHSDGAILLWNVAERRAVANFSQHQGSVYRTAFSPDGERVASAGDDRSIILWDIATGRKERVIAGGGTRIRSLAFSPDGSYLFAGDQRGVLTRHDLATHSSRRIYDEPLHAVYVVDVSPDSKYVVTSLGVHRVADGDEVVSFARRYGVLLWPSRIYGCAFSPDGLRLMCATTTGNIVALNPADWSILDHATPENEEFITLSISSDGRHFATGENGGAVRLWRLDPIRPVGALGRHEARVKAVAFSPDGKSVASASDDQTIALWDVASRRRITSIGTHTSPVLSIGFSPDGTRLVSGSHDGSVRLHTMERTLWGFRIN